MLHRSRVYWARAVDIRGLKSSDPPPRFHGGVDVELCSTQEAPERGRLRVSGAQLEAKLRLQEKAEGDEAARDARVGRPAWRIWLCRPRPVPQYVVA